MQELGKRTIQVGIALGAIVGLVGCAELADDTDAEHLGCDAVGERSVAQRSVASTVCR